MPHERQSKKAAETRESLMKAALEVMSEKGYTAATVDEIAQAAGVSKGLAYYHFHSKAEIATEILKRGIGELIERFELSVQEHELSRDALIGMLDEFTKMVVENWRFGKFYLSALWRDGRVWSEDMKDIDSKLIKIIADQFAHAQECGDVRRGVDPEFCAVASIGLVLTTSMRYFGMDDAQEKFSSNQFRNEIIEFVSHATTTHVENF